jgi:hypothetical protein
MYRSNELLRAYAHNNYGLLLEVSRGFEGGSDAGNSPLSKPLPSPRGEGFFCKRLF